MTTRRVNLNTESVDNYLKAIFTLGGPGEERVTSTALAERLGVAPASITNMLQKLAALPPPLLNTNGVAVFDCQPPVDGGRWKWCAIIGCWRHFSTRYWTIRSKRSMTKPKGWSISSLSASRSVLPQSCATQISIHMDIAFPLWTERCQSRFLGH